MRARAEKCQPDEGTGYAHDVSFNVVAFLGHSLHCATSRLSFLHLLRDKIDMFLRVLIIFYMLNGAAKTPEEPDKLRNS